MHTPSHRGNRLWHDGTGGCPRTSPWEEIVSDRERLIARIAELEKELNPRPKKARKPRIYKSLPPGKIAFRFQF